MSCCGEITILENANADVGDEGRDYLSQMGD